MSSGPIRTRRRKQADIESAAQELLRAANAISAPVDLHRVANLVGAQVKFTPLEEKVSGVLLVKGEDKHIMINSSHPPTRQRFTFAHEIGHLQLHETNNRLFIDERLRVYQRAGSAHSATYEQQESMTKPHEEQEANLFASALLMPKALLERAALERDLLDELEVSSLAASFGVSEQAMSIRLQQLGVLRPFSPSESADSPDTLL